MSATVDYAEIEQTLMTGLALRRRPVAVSFSDTPPDNATRFNGRQPAGCGFWRLASEGRSCHTTPDQHYDCAGGCHTHNIPLPPQREDELARTLEMMTQSGYLKMEEVPGIAQLPEMPRQISYVPLAEASAPADVILITATAADIMLLHEATQRAGVATGQALLGRPTCMALPAALAQGVTTSLGCIGNRVYNQAEDDAMYMAVPGEHIAAVAAELATVKQANAQLRVYHQSRNQALNKP